MITNKHKTIKQHIKLSRIVDVLDTTYPISLYYKGSYIGDFTNVQEIKNSAYIDCYIRLISCDFPDGLEVYLNEY